ncbi:hypothetical protein E5288_WYG011962 [Bos mutus]|uniref:Uncharacterized protein n=1 Tax=Bos mutus TaxID=72004 RepID=A0A6B0QZ95_9CETA|nr:hypothetical protein [Bos mutus]
MGEPTRWPSTPACNRGTASVLRCRAPTGIREASLPMLQPAHSAARQRKKVYTNSLEQKLVLLVKLKEGYQGSKAPPESLDLKLQWQQNNLPSKPQLEP